MKMNNRHKLILNILLFRKQETSVRALTYLALIYSLKSPQNAPIYSFIPDNNSPISVLLEHDIQHLVASNLIGQKQDGYFNELSSQAKNEAYSIGLDTQGTLKELIGEELSLSEEELFNFIKEKYPYLFDHKFKVATTKIYTTGYEGKTIDQFIVKLLSSGIKRLIDVRKNPVSRVFGFSKKTLSQTCSRVGIEYVHFPGVGIPTAERRGLKSPSDYQKLLDKYDSSILPNTHELQKELVTLIKESPSVLTCVEDDQSCCHRSRLAKALQKMSGMRTVHL